MNAAVGDQSEEVEAFGGERPLYCLVVRERAGRNRIIDARQVLLHHGSGPEVQVPDLGVAHLPLRQPDSAAPRGQGRVRVRGPERIEDRRVGQRDRVAGTVLRQPPPVEDDEADRRAHCAAAAAFTISTSPSGSRDAPPTRAPSMSGWPSRSPALSGFTLPPYSTRTRRAASFERSSTKARMKPV